MEQDHCSKISGVPADDRTPSLADTSILQLVAERKTFEHFDQSELGKLIHFWFKTFERLNFTKQNHEQKICGYKFWFHNRIEL